MGAGCRQCEGAGFLIQILQDIYFLQAIGGCELSGGWRGCRQSARKYSIYKFVDRFAKVLISINLNLLVQTLVMHRNTFLDCRINNFSSPVLRKTLNFKSKSLSSANKLYPKQHGRARLKLIPNQFQNSEVLHNAKDS